MICTNAAIAVLALPIIAPAQTAPEQPHYGGAEGETVVQLHGEAPFKIVLANPGS